MQDKFDKYILVDRVPVVENDIIKWGAFFRRPERVVARTQVTRKVMVSTVFLGLDHNWGGGPPLLFETMVFGGDLDDECWRYSTWDAAEAGHNKMVVRVVEAK